MNPNKDNCTVCGAGKYSLDGKGCNICPYSSICSGDYTEIIPLPLFWKFNASTNSVLYCANNPSACLGDNKCQKGYNGILCEQCDISTNHRRVEYFNCTECNSVGLIIL